MVMYIFRRLLTAIPTLFVIVTLAFFLIRIAPGGPFNQERGLSPEIRANLERQFGLDDPLWLQYFNYLKNVLVGDFGPSYVSPNFTVAEKFANGLPVSIQLGMSALVLALIIGGILGIIAALNQNKPADYAVIATATAGSTIPTFVIAPLIQLGFRPHVEAASDRWLGRRRADQQDWAYPDAVASANGYRRAPDARVHDRIHALAPYPHRESHGPVRLVGGRQTRLARGAIADCVVPPVLLRRLC
jgi:hypothetical protein